MPLSFNITDFSQVASQFQLNARASIAGTSLRVCDYLQEWASGTAFYRTALPLSPTTDFSTRFEVSVTRPLDDPNRNDLGDSFSFILQYDNNNGQDPLLRAGGSGDRAGYQDIDKSIAFRWITYHNNDFIRLFKDGQVYTDAIAWGYDSAGLRGADNYNVWVDYSAFNYRLRLFAARGNVKPTTPIIQTTINLNEATRSNQVYMGFGGANGGWRANYDIKNWEFTENPRYNEGHSLTSKPVLAGSLQTSYTGAFRPLRINCGATVPYIDTEGNYWGADVYHTQSDTVREPSREINGTLDDFIYQFARAGWGGGFEYRIPVPDGSYLVKIHIRELYSWDERTQTIFINNQARTTDLVTDWNSTLAQPLVLEYPDVSPVNGLITIRAVATRNSAWINAIEVENAEGVKLTPVQVSGSGTITRFNVFGSGSVNLKEVRTYDFPSDYVLVTYPNFTGGNNLKLNGNASITGSGVLQITPQAGDQNGNAWYIHKVPFSTTEEFHTNFTVQMVGDGADGMAFVIQNDDRGTSLLASRGGAIGYGSDGAIQKSVIIEFDPFSGGGDDRGNNNHIALHVNGDTYNARQWRVYPTDLNSGNMVYCWVDYYRAGTRLEFYASATNSKPSEPFFTDTIDIPAFTQGDAYIGFTGATGGLFQFHNVIDWSFNYGQPSPLKGGEVSESQVNNISGSGQTFVPNMVVAGTGSRPIRGNATIALNPLNVAGAGQRRIVATGSVSTRKPTIAGSGAYRRIPRASGSVNTKKLTLPTTNAANRRSFVAATGSTPLKSAVASGSGFKDLSKNISGAASVSLKPCTASSTGVASHRGTGSVPLQPLGASGGGQRFITGTGATSTSSVNCSGGAGYRQNITGSGSVSLKKTRPPLSGNHSGTVSHRGAGGTSVSGVIAQGFALLQRRGQATIPLDRLSVQGTGSVSHQSSGACDLKPVAVQGQGKCRLMPQATGAIALNPASVSGAGTFRNYPTGTGDLNLSSATVTGVVKRPPRASGGVTLSRVILDGEVLKNAVKGTGSLTVARLIIKGREEFPLGELIQLPEAGSLVFDLDALY